MCQVCVCPLVFTLAALCSHSTALCMPHKGFGSNSLGIQAQGARFCFLAPAENVTDLTACGKLLLQDGLPH